jgi:hypothetical protein
LLCLFTEDLFLCPFSGTGSVFCQLTPCYQCVVMAHCLFFNFVKPFGFGCCNAGSGDELCVLLPALFQAVTYQCLLLDFLPFQCLFTDDSQRSAPCHSPFLQCTHSFYFVLVFSLLFIVQLFFFFLFLVGGPVCPGGYAGLSQG